MYRNGTSIPLPYVFFQYFIHMNLRTWQFFHMSGSQSFLNGQGKNCKSNLVSRGSVNGSEPCGVGEGTGKGRSLRGFVGEQFSTDGILVQYVMRTHCPLFLVTSRGRSRCHSHNNTLFYSTKPTEMSNMQGLALQLAS